MRVFGFREKELPRYRILLHVGPPLADHRKVAYTGIFKFVVVAGTVLTIHGKSIIAVELERPLVRITAPFIAKLWSCKLPGRSLASCLGGRPCEILFPNILRD